MKNKGFGHLKTRLFTIKPSKNVGLGGPWYMHIPEMVGGVLPEWKPVSRFHHVVDGFPARCSTFKVVMLK